MAKAPKNNDAAYGSTDPNAIIRNRKGKVLPQYPKLVRNAEGRKILCQNEQEEAKVLATKPKQVEAPQQSGGNPAGGNGWGNPS